MVTADSVKAKIQNLINKANTTTGKSDTDLTSGVNSLVYGYGQGDPVPVWDEDFTLSDDTEEIAVGEPIEIDALDNTLLTEENENRVYKCDDKLYQVNKVKSLKGLTIKFNEHITPCPVIGEDDVFECSGVYLTSMYMPPLTTIKAIGRKLYNDSSATANISFIVDTEYGGRLDIFYGETYLSAEPMWQIYDENGNVSGPDYGERAITNFDCPALNENPEFIEWVFANAKVYSKIEDLSDIKAFRYNFLPIYDYYLALVELTLALSLSTLDEETGKQDTTISGLFTISFLINGELVTKTFDRCECVWYTTACYAFSNSNNNDILLLEGNDNDGTTTIKYNDITLDDSVLTFTNFKCVCNHPEMFIVHILRFAELIDMEYINGYSFAEYRKSVISFKSIVKTTAIFITEANTTVVDNNAIMLEV